jgi:hypothetical protein
MRVEVVNVPAVSPEREPRSPPTAHELVEKLAKVLAVLNASDLLVLPAEAEAL